MASTYLHRTLGSTVTVTTITISCWVKRSSLGSTQRFFSHMISGFGQYFYFRFDNEDTLGFASANSGNYNINYKTNRKFRDTNSWYHLVAKIDTTAAGGNRVKIYVNGVQETSFATSSEPDQNSTFQIGTTSDPMVIGALYGNGYGIGSGSSSEHFDGSMSHFYFIDGTAYDASAFGETDATTGEWKAKTSPSVTYGTNGFLILKDGNTITDQSSNSNDFTLGGGTLTDLKDNPDNVFATLNPLDTSRGLSNGNTTYAGASGGTVVKGTLAVNSGKYYAECKIVDAGENMIGVLDIGQAPTTNYVGHSSVGWGIYTGDGNLYHNSSASSYSSAFADNDIMGIALDMDNNKLYFSKNGVWQNSGVPTSGSTGTGAISITSGLTMTFCGGRDHANDTASFNFGNGYFGTTAITTNSGNGYSGAEGSSKFNYTVPTGYSALSTKGLNE